MLTNTTDRCAIAIYSRIRRTNRLHGDEFTLIPFLFFVVGVLPQNQRECYCCNELDGCKEAMSSDVSASRPSNN